MRILVLASLLVALVSVASVPTASAGVCDAIIDFDDNVDQTGGLACATVDWAIVGGPSPVWLAVGYAGCYVFSEPPASWVPDCS